MSKHALHAVSIDVLAKEQRRGRVPQIVEAHWPHLRGGPELHAAVGALAQIAVAVPHDVRRSALLAAPPGVDPVVDQAPARERRAQHSSRNGTSTSAMGIASACPPLWSRGRTSGANTNAGREIPADFLQRASGSRDIEGATKRPERREPGSGRSHRPATQGGASRHPTTRGSYLSRLILQMTPVFGICTSGPLYRQRGSAGLQNSGAL